MVEDSLLSDSAGALVTKNVPTASTSDHAKDILTKLSRREWDSITVTYILSDSNELLGVVPISKLVAAEEKAQMHSLMQKPSVIIIEDEDKERVAVEAIANDLKSMPVNNKDGKFLGAITADKILDVLHEEHLEDFLRSSGIRGKGSRILDLMSANFFELIKSRLPWLVVGLAIGLLASVVVSFFEGPVKENIALVFFMPVVAFMSGAIGTQTETVFIRSLTYLKINVFQYIVKELILGMIIGGVIALITGVFGYFLSSSFTIAIVVSVSIFISMSVATILGVLVPLLLRALKKDPAVGSGPFITSLQDLISLTIYFSIAYWLLG